MYRFDVDYIDEERGIKNIPCADGDYVLAEDALALQAKIEELEEANTRRKNLNTQMLMSAAESGNRNYLAEIDRLQAKIEELERINENRCKVHLMSIKKIDELEDKVERLDAALTQARLNFNTTTKYGRGWHDALNYVGQFYHDKEGE